MSLSEGNPRLDLGRETDIADLRRFDPDAPQDELAVDDLADANVHDLAVSRKCGDWIARRAESSYVLVGELRRHRRLWLRRRRRRRRGLRLDDRLRNRWWRGRGRWLLVREEISRDLVASALRFEPLHVHRPHYGSGGRLRRG